jgi:acetamidase/formamidase
VLDAAAAHHEWDNSLAAVLRIRSGDTVAFSLPMSGDGQVSEQSTAETTTFDFATIYNLLGPIWIEEAHPGETLAVEVLKLEPGPWGWCAILPELGLLPDEFADFYLRIFDLRQGSHTQLSTAALVPIRPFLGTMGTHPDEPTVNSPFPPHKGGGNVDTRHLVEGSTLFLPVWCEGALFSCGDPHAAQGDGEVCVAAIECSMAAVLRFTLERRQISGPAFYTHVETNLGPSGHYGTMGLSTDLMDGARIAVRDMIQWIQRESDLSREDAYMLCSLAGDLRIFEIVDAGVWNVGFTLPRDVLRIS